ncbi:hypothetical protein ABEB36_015547 [Hypothenemus hampei]|uniref:Uncharacterized protein n=1 Tax=Hypothenemus hampei TaxID=57062 RepID=A0ABD1DZH5_HYPHA
MPNYTLHRVSPEGINQASLVHAGSQTPQHGPGKQQNSEGKQDFLHKKETRMRQNPLLRDVPKGTVPKDQSGICQVGPHANNYLSTMRGPPQAQETVTTQSKVWKILTWTSQTCRHTAKVPTQYGPRGHKPSIRGPYREPEVPECAREPAKFRQYRIITSHFLYGKNQTSLIGRSPKGTEPVTARCSKGNNTQRSVWQLPGWPPYQQLPVDNERTPTDPGNNDNSKQGMENPHLDLTNMRTYRKVRKTVPHGLKTAIPG